MDGRWRHERSQYGDGDGDGPGAKPDESDDGWPWRSEERPEPVEPRPAGGTTDGWWIWPADGESTPGATRVTAEDGEAHDEIGYDVIPAITSNLKKKTLDKPTI